MARFHGIPLVAAGALFLGALAGPAASAHSASAAETKPSAPSAGEILLRMTAPEQAPLRDSITADDLRELPKPRPDQLPGNVRIIVVPGADPSCLPGEDLTLPHGAVPPRARGR